MQKGARIGTPWPWPALILLCTCNCRPHSLPFTITFLIALLHRPIITASMRAEDHA